MDIAGIITVVSTYKDVAENGRKIEYNTLAAKLRERTAEKFEKIRVRDRVSDFSRIPHPPV